MESTLKILLISIFLIVPGALSGADAHSWFWFIYENRSAKTDSFTAVRPFFLKNTYPNGSEYRTVLPPVVYSRYDNSRGYRTYALFSLAGQTSIYSKPEDDYDMILPPVFYGSGSTSRDRYLMIWPFGGTLKQKLGYDYITPVLFPGVALFFIYPPNTVIMTALYCAACIIPLYAEYGYRDYHAKTVLWPIFMKGSGGGRESIRILPFYAHHTKKGFYDRKMYLLLYNYGETYTPKRTYFTRFLFPFFGKKWTNDGLVKSRTVLWPFFSWGYNKLNGEEFVNFPWPIFQKGKSDKPKTEKLILFPFYGKYKYESRTTVFYTPLYFRQTKEKISYCSDYRVMFLIIWKFHREYRLKEHEYYGRKWDYFKIWPLFHYESNDRGDRDFSLLSIFFFRDPDGYERLYSPLFSIAEYHRRGGFKSFGILFRTYYQVQNGGHFQWKIPGLAGYSSYEGRTTEFSLLFSSFGMFHDERGRGFRFLWIPIVTNKEDKIVFDKPVMKEDFVSGFAERRNMTASTFGLGTVF